MKRLYQYNFKHIILINIFKFYFNLVIIEELFVDLHDSIFISTLKNLFFKIFILPFYATINVTIYCGEYDHLVFYFYI
jgi:hypothetical protein